MAFGRQQFNARRDRNGACEVCAQRGMLQEVG